MHDPTPPELGPGEPDGSRRGPPRARWASSVTWIVLGAGLLLTVILYKLGVWFFFLPIVIPFGFGGGRSLTEALRRSPDRRDPPE